MLPALAAVWGAFADLVEEVDRLQRARDAARDTTAEEQRKLPW